MQPTSGTCLLFVSISIVCNMKRPCHIMTYNPYDWLTNQMMKDEVRRTDPVVQPCNSHMVSLNLPTLHYIIQWPIFIINIFFQGKIFKEWYHRYMSDEPPQNILYKLMCTYSHTYIQKQLTTTLPQGRMRANTHLVNIMIRLLKRTFKHSNEFQYIDIYGLVFLRQGFLLLIYIDTVHF